MTSCSTVYAACFNIGYESMVWLYFRCVVCYGSN